MVLGEDELERYYDYVLVVRRSRSVLQVSGGNSEFAEARIDKYRQALFRNLERARIHCQLMKPEGSHAAAAAAADSELEYYGLWCEFKVLEEVAQITKMKLKLKVSSEWHCAWNVS